MMLYYYTKSGCKPTSSLEDTTDIPRSDLNTKHSEWIFLHGTLAYDAA